MGYEQRYAPNMLKLREDEVFVSLGPYGQGQFSAVVPKRELEKMSSPQQLLEYMVKKNPPTGLDAVVAESTRRVMQSDGTLSLFRQCTSPKGTFYDPTTVHDLSVTGETNVGLSVRTDAKVGYK